MRCPLLLTAAAGMVCVTMRPKDGPLDSTELPQRPHGSLGSINEGARRLASFQRLLSRARADETYSSSGDLHQQQYEGGPLRAAAGEPGGDSGQVQMQQLGVEGLHPQQQHEQHVLSSLQKAREQQQHEQVVLLGHLHAPAGASDDLAHSMHHRHAPASPLGSPGGGDQAAQPLLQQQQQLFVPVPSGRL
jgi:hypothetical protein